MTTVTGVFDKQNIAQRIHH